MSQHTVKISVELEMLKNSVDDIQKVLNTLKPDTKAFTALQNVVKNMTKDLGAAQANIAKGFSSNADFKATEKIIERISAALSKTGDITKNIKFSDLKLDKATTDQYSKLVDDLKKARHQYENFQKTMVKDTLAQGNNKQILQAINPDLVNKSFDEIVKGISDGVKAAENELQQLQEAYAKLQEQMTKTQNVQTKVSGGYNDTLSSLLDPATFKKFFATKQNGDVIFKSVRGGHIQEQFLQYVQEQFSIPDNKIEQLRNKTAKQIQNALGNGNFWDFLSDVNKNQQAQQIDLSKMIGDVQTNIADFTQLGQAFGATGVQATQFSTNIDNLNNNIKKLQSNTLNTNNAIKGIPISMSAAASQLQNFKTQLEQANATMLKYQQMQNTFNSIKFAVLNFMGFTQVLSLVKRGVKDAAKNIKQLDTVMNGIAIVTKMSTSDLWNQVDAYTKMAQQYGVTTKGAYEVSKIYYQQGLQQKDVMALTEQTLKLSKISGLDYATTTDYMTTALRGFKMEMAQASRVVDVYSALAANTAVSQQQLAEAMTRTASSMESVGSTFEEASAMISTMVAVTRQSASNIGSALKSIASRYGEMKKAPEDLMDSEGEALSFNKVDAALQSVGINMKTTENQFRSFTDVIIELSDKWNTLESTQQRYIATQFAGNRQQSRFLALVSNGDLLKNNLRVAEESQGTGTTQALTALDSLESKINQVQNAYQQFYLDIGAENLWKGFLDGAKNVLNTLNSFPKLFGKIPIVAISAIMNIVNTGKTFLMASLQQLANLITPAIQTALQQANQAAATGATQIGTTIKTNMLQGFGGASGIASLIGSVISSASLMIDKQTKDGQLLSGILNSIGGAVQGGAGIAQLFIPGQQAAGIMNVISGTMSIIASISTLWETAEERIARVTNEAKQLSDRAAQLKGEERSLQNLKNQYDELKEKQYDSQEAAQEFRDIQNSIADEFPSLVQSIDAVGNATINATALEQQLAAARQASAEATLQAAKKELEAKKDQTNLDKSRFDESVRTFTDENKAISTARKTFEGKAWYDDLLTVKNNKSTYEGLSIEQSILREILVDSRTALQSALEDIDNSSFDIIQEYISNYKKNQITLQELFSNIKNELDRSNQGNKAQGLYNLLQQVVPDTDSTLTFLQDYNNFLDVINNFTHNENIVDQDRNNLREQFNNFNNAYKTYIDNGGNPVQKYANIIGYYTNLFKELGESFNNQQLAEKNVLQTQLKVKQVQLNSEIGNGIENILNVNQIYSLISEKIFADNYTTQAMLDSEIDALQLEWQQLNEEAQKIISNRSGNLQNYSNVDAFFDGINIETDNLLYDFFRERIQFSSQNISQRFEDFANQQVEKTSRGAAKDAIQSLVGDDINTEAKNLVARAIIGVIQQIEDYEPDEQIQLVGQAGNELTTILSQLPEEIQQAISNNGLLTHQGIENTLKQIRETKVTATTEEQTQLLNRAEAALITIQEHLISYVGLSIQEYQQTVLQRLKDQQKDISKLQSGMSVPEVKEILDNLNTWSKQQGKSKVFSVQTDIMRDTSGKLVMTNQSLNEAYEVWADHLKENSLDIQATLTEMQQFITQLNSYNNESFEHGAGEDAITANTEILRTLLGEEQFSKLLGWDSFSKSYYLLGDGSLEDRVSNFKQAIEEAYNNLKTPFEGINEFIQLGIDSLALTDSFKKGDYSTLKDKDIIGLASTIDRELRESERTLVSQWRSSVLNALNDTIQYGTQYVQNKNYDYLDDNMRIMLQSYASTNNLQGFIKSYYYTLGLTFEQANDYILKIQESSKDLSQKNTVKDIISTLEFFDTQTAYITEAKAAELASIANLFTENIIDKTQQKDINGQQYYKLITEPLTDIDEQFTLVDNYMLQRALSIEKKIETAKNYLSSANVGVQQQIEFSELLKNLGYVLDETGTALIKQNGEQIVLFIEKNGNMIVNPEVGREISQQSKNNQTIISNIVKKVNLDTAQQTTQDAINALQSVSKIQKSGTSNLSEMQGIIETIKGYNQEFAGTLTNGAFEYSTALHGFVISAKTVQQYINALTDALSKATDAASKQQTMDQLRSLYLQMGDIEKFVDTFDEQFIAHRGPQEWGATRSAVIKGLQRGNASVLTKIPEAMTYMDQIEQVIINRADGISNLIKLFTENGKLITQDIERNRNAFIGTEYQKLDAGIIKDKLKTLDDFKQFAKTYGQDALKAYHTGVLQSQQEQEEALLNILQDNAKVSLDQIKKLGSILGGPLLQDGKLTELGEKFLIKEGQHFITNGPAIREYIKENQNNNDYLIQEIQKVEADLREKQNSNIKTVFEYLIEANNDSKVKQITNVSDELLDAAEKIVKENLSLTSLITVDREKRSIQFKDNYIGDIAIESAMKKYKQAFGNDFDNIINNISNTAQQRFKLIKEMLNNATDISKEQISKAKDLNLSSLLSTAGGRTTLNLGKVQQYITKEADAFQQYRVQTLNNMLSEYSSEEMLGQFFTKESFKKEDLDLVLGDYNQLHGTQITYEDDWLKIQNGKAKWTYKGLQKWINELQAQEFDISKQVIAEKNNELYEVLQKLLQNQALDQEDIDILQSHGVTASTGKGMQYDSRTKQVAKAYLKEISQIPSKLQEFASTMWDFGYVDQFVEAATQLSGYGQSDKEGLKNAIINRDLDALTTKYKTGLGAFYSTVFSSLNSDVESVFSLVLQQATLGNGQQGYIDVKKDPQLKMLIQNLGLDNILHEETDTYGNIIGYFVDGIDTIRDAVISAIFDSGLQGKTKLSLRRQARNSIQQELSASDITPILTSAYDNISIELVDNLIEALGITDENEINDFINKYFIDEGNHLRQTQELRQALLSEFKYLYDPKELNEVEQTLNQMDRERSEEISFRDVALNYKNLSNELVKKLATNLNIDFNVLRDQLGYDFITDTYDPNKVKAYLDANKDKFNVDVEIQKMYDAEAEAIKDSFSNLFSGISSVLGQGTYQAIETSTENSQMLAFIASQLPDMMQGVADQNGNIYKYILHATQQNITAAIDVLTLLRDNDEIRENSGLSNVTDAEINNLITSLKSSQAAISPQTLLTDLLKDYTNIAYDKLYLVSQTLGLDIEKIATEQSPGQYKLNLDNIQEIVNSINTLWSQGLLSDEVKNNLLSQIKSIQWQESPESTVLKIIQSGNEISSELMTELINKIGPQAQQLITQNFNLQGTTYVGKTESAVQNLVQGLSINFQQWMLDLLEQQANDVLQILNSLSGQVISGINSTTEMKKVLDELNAGRDDASKLSYSDIYQYSDTTHSFILTQTGIAEELKRFNKDLLDKYGSTPEDLQLLEKQRQSFMHNLGEQIDIKAVLDATGQLEKTQATQALLKSIDNYNFAAGQTGYQEITNDLITEALNGSFDAISQIYTILGRTMTFDEQSSIINASAEKLIKATDVFTAAIGSNIDQYAAQLLQRAGGAAERQGTSDVWKITESISPDKLANAYMQAYYQGLSQNLSQDKLNDLLKKSWDASAAQDKSIANALSNAASMTLSEFGNFLEEQGYTLTDQIMQQMQDEGIFSMIDTNNLRLNLHQFAQKFNVNESSKEFIEAYSSLQDAVIEEQTRLRESIEEEINSILEAKPGDILNLSTLANIFKDTSIFEDFGILLKDGMATIVEESDLLGIAGAIAQACNETKMIIPQQLQAIQDAIQEVLQGFIDALASGISGNLSGSSKRTVISQAKQLLGKELSDNDFIRTADGFKLTTDAAIDMYSALKQIDSVQASKLFDSLSQRTFGSTAGMQTMTGQMQRIADLQRQINTLRQKQSSAGEKDAQANIEATIGKLQQELELYQQIAQARAGGDPSSYDFMGQSLPDYLKGPQNYWNAWGNAFSAMHDAAENGGYAIQDFYNIVNEMNNVAGLTGQKFQIFGQTLDGGIQNMTKLIEKGFQSIKNIDGKGAKVTLDNIGIDFASGAAGMSGNIEDGIHAMAQSQIDMLDGLIAFLETIVAMQKLGSVDTDFSGSIDMGEIFANGTDWANGFTKEFDGFRTQILNMAKDNKDLQNAIQNTQITLDNTTMSLQQLFTKGAQDFNKLGVNAQTFVSAFDSFYKLVQSNDFNIQNPLAQQNLDLIAQSGLNLQYQMPDGNTLTVKDGQWIMSSQPGKYVVDGQQFTDPNAALTYRNKKSAEDTMKSFADSHKGNERLELSAAGQTLTLKASGFTFDIKPGQNKGFVVNDKQCKDWAAVEQAMIDELNAGRQQAYTTREARIRLGLEVVPELHADASQLSSSQIAKLKADGIDSWQSILDSYGNTEDSQLEFEVKYGFKPAQDVSADVQAAFNEQLNQPDVELKANITADGESVKISGPIHVDLVADKIDVSGAQLINGALGGTENSATSDTSLNNQNANKDVVESFNNIGNDMTSAAEQTGEAVTSAGQAVEGAVDNLGSKLEAIHEQQAKIAKQNDDLVSVSDAEGRVINPEKTSTSSKENDGLFAQAQVAVQAAQDTLSQASQQVGQAASQAGTAMSQLGSAAGQLSSAAGEAASGVTRAAGAIRNTYNNLPSGSKPPVHVSVEVEVKATNATVTSQSPIGAVQVAAKGNVALAGGQKTLMGQLGPEMVVSNGRYFLVGQAGAEMVDLAPDAIVFNHLQTKKLLSNGHTGRGKPITNEHTAVAWAKGTGPAMASAEAVLAALKQIRAMWQAMLGASMKDLGALAGNEGGGGGGGGGKKPPQLKAILDDIERWYNLVRQIAKIEQDITYQQTLQSKLQSDRIANGQALYKSYKREIELLDAEIVRNQQLAMLQKSYYEAKRKEFTESDYGRFYTYDENGLLQLKDGIDKGMDVLFKLNEKNVYGETSGAATNAKTQIEYLRSIGFNTENLKYNGDGTVIDESSDEYKDNPDKIYEDMMNNFWDNLDGWKDDLDSIYDEYHEQLNTVLENEDKRNQLLQTIVDNQLSVEQDVLKAIEAREQKLIDQLQDERDALEKSTQNYIDGLTDQLKEERQMYENAENEKQLVKLRRQVAILQRSGGSASQIRSLQEQIAAKEQDQYFTQQQQQIAAIQKASDLQIERMDSQIQLMTQALEYQKEQGLLWDEVYQIMAGTPQQIRHFIMENTPDFQSASALDVAEKIRDIDLRINEWVSYRDDKSAPDVTGSGYYDWNSYSASRDRYYGSRASDELKAQAKEEFDRVLKDTGDINLAGEAADAIFKAVLGEMPRIIEEEEKDTINNNNPISNAAQNYRDYNYGNTKTSTTKTSTSSTSSSGKKTFTFSASEVGQDALMNEMNSLQKQISVIDPRDINAIRKKQQEFNKKYDLLNVANKKKYTKYASGGLVNYTGLAQVDGTPQRPEAFLNAEQTELLRNHLFGRSDSLLSLAQQLVQQLHGASYSSSTLHQEENNGINIQNVDVNVNVKQIANDYDVRSIGNTVMDEILKIARKSGTRGLSRR